MRSEFHRISQHKLYLAQGRSMTKLMKELQDPLFTGVQMAMSVVYRSNQATRGFNRHNAAFIDVLKTFV